MTVGVTRMTKGTPLHCPARTTAQGSEGPADAVWPMRAARVPALPQVRRRSRRRVDGTCSRLGHIRRLALQKAACAQFPGAAGHVIQHSRWKRAKADGALVPAARGQRIARARRHGARRSQRGDGRKPSVHCALGTCTNVATRACSAATRPARRTRMTWLNCLRSLTTPRSPRMGTPA